MFLKLPTQEWPKQDYNEDNRKEAMTECVKNPPDTTHTILSKENNALKGMTGVVDLNKFSSKIKAIRAQAWVLRFIRNLKALVRSEKLILNKVLSTTELELTEETIIGSIQQEAFQEEIEFVKSKCPRGKTHQY